MAFWRRKNKEQFISLGLNTPSRAEEKTAPEQEASGERLQAPAALEQESTVVQAGAPAAPILEPTPTGGAPTPPPADETQFVSERPQPVTPQAPPRTDARPAEPLKPAVQKPVPSRSTFSSSILGLDRSIEELQAEEAALEQEFAARFRRAVASTRESLSEKIDTIFQVLKQIDS